MLVGVPCSARKSCGSVDRAGRKVGQAVSPCGDGPSGPPTTTSTSSPDLCRGWPCWWWPDDLDSLPPWGCRCSGPAAAAGVVMYALNPSGAADAQNAVQGTHEPPGVDEKRAESPNPGGGRCRERPCWPSIGEFEPLPTRARHLAVDPCVERLGDAARDGGGAGRPSSSRRYMLQRLHWSTSPAARRGH